MRNLGKLRVRFSCDAHCYGENTFHINTPVEAIARFADVLKKQSYDVEITKAVVAQRNYILSAEGSFLIDTGVGEIPLQVEKA